MNFTPKNKTSLKNILVSANTMSSSVDFIIADSYDFLTILFEHLKYIEQVC